MQTIVEIKFGSHLYGTNTPDSDLDIKGLYFPTAREILLQQIQPSVSRKRPKAHGEKNTSLDVDYELYSPERFLAFLVEGQIMALDMLFAPPYAMLADPHPIWWEIKALAPQLFTKKAASFVRYCQRQANKYGIKGSRVAAARMALEVLNAAEGKHGPAAKLEVIADTLQDLANGNEFLTIGESIEPNGNKVVYFDICGKKALMHASLKMACSIAQRLLDEYGMRALAAARGEGVDWKALSHAVRVGHEALEFLQTKHITFPRPEAQHLLNIKQGKVAFQRVREEIEDLMLNVEQAAAASELPDDFEQNVIDEFIIKLHHNIILQEERRC